MYEHKVLAKTITMSEERLYCFQVNVFVECVE